MGARIVEEIHGEGQVRREDSSAPGEASYRLTVSEDDAGRKSVGGYLGGLDDPFALVGQKVTLRMEDGRSIDLIVCDLSGRVEAASSIRDAP